MAGAKGEKMEEQKQANNGANYAPGGANTQKEEKKGIKKAFDDFLKEGKYQAEFDRRVQKAIHTTQRKWEEKNNQEISEAERLKKMNETEKLQYQLQKQQKEYKNLKKKLKAKELKQKLALLVLDEWEE